MESLRDALPITYLAIYRANLRAPESDLYVARGDFEIKLSPGPIQFSCTIPVRRYHPPAAWMTLAQQHRDLPRDSYVVMRTRSPGMDPESVRSMAALAVAEATCVFDLRYPELISEKLYEGTVDQPGESLLMLEGPLRLTAQPVRDPKDVADEVAGDLSSLEKLSPQDRDRFRLAARWFRRGQEAINPVDRLLFFWTVLEIYPAKGELKVPGKASKLLRQQVYQDLSDQQIKEKTKIGRIEGLRGSIVHEGKAFVVPAEEKQFSDYLDRLHAVAGTCLRILAGMSPGEDLDKYVREN